MDEGIVIFLAIFYFTIDGEFSYLVIGWFMGIEDGDFQEIIFLICDQGQLSISGV